MRKVALRLKEQESYECIKRYVDQGTNLDRICLQLNISKKTARRMIAGYKEHGKSYFVHGNRDRAPSTTIPDDVKSRIVAIYKDPLYIGANFKHFHELLERNFPELPKISLSSLHNILKKNKILSPKVRKATIKKLKEEEKFLHATLDQMELTNSLLNLPIDHSAHPRREKSRYFSELVFMDASAHPWFEGIISHLHASIDDATGIVTGAYFDDQETLKGYYNVLYQILTNYGIPYEFQTDGRTIFEYAAFKKPKIEKDTYTQFGFACKTLGINLKTTHIVEYQGKIERLFQTFQSRLVVELRINGIKTIKEANEFLSLYLPQYNERFATSLEHNTLSVLEDKPTVEKINLTLAVLSKRLIDNGNCIRYENRYWRLIDNNGQKANLRPKTQVRVIKAFDNTLYAACKETVFLMEEVNYHKEQSFNFDQVQKHQQKHEKIPYIPAMQHPWKTGVFDNYWKEKWDKHYSFDELCYTTENVYSQI